MNSANQYVLKLTVNNHPGVMSRVCGLFSRRCYNLEGVMVLPIKNSGEHISRVFLLLNNSDNPEQIIMQTEKLIDVLDIERCALEGSVFESSQHYFSH